MVQEEKQHDDLRTDVVSTVKYDLLGKIAANTRLTRKTIAGILSQIKPEKFNMYKMNPEEFIRRVSRLILEQKATIIVDHISYNEIEEATIRPSLRRRNIPRSTRLTKAGRASWIMCLPMERQSRVWSASL